MEFPDFDISAADIGASGQGWEDAFDAASVKLDASGFSPEQLLASGDGGFPDLQAQIENLGQVGLNEAKEVGTNAVKAAENSFNMAVMTGDPSTIADAKVALESAIANKDSLVASAIAKAKDNMLGYISHMPTQLGGLVQKIGESTIDQLYNNPMAAVLTSSGLIIDKLTAKVTELSTMTITGDSPVDLVQLKSDALAFISTGSLAGLSTSMGDFATHTGKLAGTIQNLVPGAPGLNSVLSIGSQMRTASQLLGGAGDCLQMVGSMTGLFAGGPVTAASSILSSSFDQLNRGINVFANLAGQVSAMKNLVDTVISKDAQFLQNSISRLKQVATASILTAVASDPCGRFVLTQVGQAGLLKKIPGM